jgi:iron complex transport system substrate-binding protein
MTGRWLKRPGLLLFATLLAVLAAACGDSDDGGGNGDDAGSNGEFTDDFSPIPGFTETGGGYPITIARSDGEELTLEQAPTRVVSLSPAATEIIYAIDGESALVAVDNQADYPGAAANFETKVDAFEPNVEAIAALEPDLVIVHTNSSGIVEALDRLNIPVLYQDIDTAITRIEDVFGQVSIMGQVLDKRDEAAALVANLNERLNNIEGVLRQQDSSLAPRVYHELDAMFFTASENSFIGDVYHTLRIRNIAGDGGGQAYPQLTQEAIISANPDIIVLADEEFGVTIESVKQRPGWDAISAVQNDRIYPVDPDIISRPGPRIIEALEQLAREIYPERFS